MQSDAFSSFLDNEGVQALLCYFHVPKSVKEFLHKKPRLNLFLSPLLSVLHLLERSDTEEQLDRRRLVAKAFVHRFFPSE
jgi:hypothetical protein